MTLHISSGFVFQSFTFNMCFSLPLTIILSQYSFHNLSLTICRNLSFTILCTIFLKQSLFQSLQNVRRFFPAHGLVSLQMRLFRSDSRGTNDPSENVIRNKRSFVAACEEQQRFISTSLSLCSDTRTTVVIGLREWQSCVRAGATNPFHLRSSRTHARSRRYFTAETLESKRQSKHSVIYCGKSKFERNE